MPYAKRDKRGNITELHSFPTGEAQERVFPDDLDVLQFISDNSRPKDELSLLLSSSDHELARVVEDVVEVLVDRGVIMYTDLPSAAQDKLNQRRQARDDFKSEPSIMLKRDEIL